jgi:hypothetical protein
MIKPPNIDPKGIQLRNNGPESIPNKGETAEPAPSMSLPVPADKLESQTITITSYPKPLIKKQPLKPSVVSSKLSAPLPQPQQPNSVVLDTVGETQSTITKYIMNGQ